MLFCVSRTLNERYFMFYAPSKGIELCGIISDLHRRRRNLDCELPGGRSKTIFSVSLKDEMIQNRDSSTSKDKILHFLGPLGKNKRRSSHPNFKGPT